MKMNNEEVATSSSRKMSNSRHQLDHSISDFVLGQKSMLQVEKQEELLLKSERAYICIARFKLGTLRICLERIYSTNSFSLKLSFKSSSLTDRTPPSYSSTKLRLFFTHLFKPGKPAK